MFIAAPDTIHIAVSFRATVLFAGIALEGRLRED
jgi:hypothetical protein